MTPSFFTAEPCDASDPAPGVRLIRQCQIINRLSVDEARGLAAALLDAAAQAVPLAPEEVPF